MKKMLLAAAVATAALVGTGLTRPARAGAGSCCDAARCCDKCPSCCNDKCCTADNCCAKAPTCCK